MRVIKRNGAEVEFDIVKIIAAVTKANDVVDEEARMTPVQIQRIAESVEFSCQSLGRAPTVEEIQDFVEHQIMAHGAPHGARLHQRKEDARAQGRCVSLHGLPQLPDA